MPRLQLSFHATFALKKQDLIKILQVAAEDQGLNDTLENLMTRTGLGNRKVHPIINWGKRSGLVKDQHLTPEGKLVFKLDPYLESDLTAWLMHFYLSFGAHGLQSPPSEPSDWGGWSYFIYTFLPQHQSFTAEELHHHSASVFEQEKAKSKSENFRIVLRSYTESQGLAASLFLTKQEQKYHCGNGFLPNSYLIGYFLAKLWERDFKDESSVLSESLLNQKMSLAGVLALNSPALQEQLNKLEAYGIIEQRRTVPPFQIVRRWDDPLTLLEKAYG